MPQRLEVSRAEAEAHAARTEAKEAKEALRRVERETEAEVQLLQAETAVAKDRVKGLEKELERMARQRQQTDRLLDQAKHQRICDATEARLLSSAGCSHLTTSHHISPNLACRRRGRDEGAQPAAHRLRGEPARGARWAGSRRGGAGDAHGEDKH